MALVIMLCENGLKIMDLKFRNADFGKDSSEKNLDNIESCGRMSLKVRKHYGRQKANQRVF